MKPGEGHLAAIGEGPGPSSLNLCGWRHPKSQGGGGRSRAEPGGRGVLCSSKGGTAPGLEKGPGQSGEAVITGDVLLQTPGEGKPAGTPWLVGTIPGLLIRRLANTTCAPAVSLTPCLLAKPLLQEPSRDGEAGSSEPPGCDSGLSSRAQAPLVVLEPAVDRGVSGEGGSVLHIDCPSGQVSPSRRATCCPCPDMKSFNSQTTPMKCHGKFDKNQEEVKLTLGDGRVK